MVLAEMRHIPRVWAAVIRVMSVPRSLVAYERGRRWSEQGLRLRGAVPQGDHRVPDLARGRRGGVRPPVADRQHRARDRRPVEQRVGGERQAPRRHGADRVAGATRVRDAADEHGSRDRAGARRSAICSCSPTRAGIRRPTCSGRTSCSSSRRRSSPSRRRTRGRGARCVRRLRCWRERPRARRADDGRRVS